MKVATEENKQVLHCAFCGKVLTLFKVVGEMQPDGTPVMKFCCYLCDAEITDEVIMEKTENDEELRKLI